MSRAAESEAMRRLRSQLAEHEADAAALTGQAIRSAARAIGGTLHGLPEDDALDAVAEWCRSHEPDLMRQAAYHHGRAVVVRAFIAQAGPRAPYRAEVRGDDVVLVRRDMPATSSGLGGAA